LCRAFGKKANAIKSDNFDKDFVLLRMFGRVVSGQSFGIQFFPYALTI
jgi:hypothetical protein